MPAQPFVVEDGTGLSSANSLLGLEEARDHALLRLNEDFLAADEERRKAALVAATAYIGRYRYRGRLYRWTQALPFPRAGLFDADGRLLTGVPQRVKDAVAEGARRALAGELEPDVSGGSIERISAGSVTVQYAEPDRGQRGFPAIEAILRPLMAGGGTHNFRIAR